MWYVYIVECEDGKLYTGMTQDVDRRLREHKHKGSHFTSYNYATKILYKETFPDKHQAARREKQIKGWVRKKKVALIESQNPNWEDLSKD